MPIRLSCPSCNTGFTLDVLPADRRATCPRCADVFPVRGTQESGDRDQETGVAQIPGVPTPGSPVAHAARWSVQRTVVVGVAMGFIGLLVGLGVYYVRGGFRTKPAPEPELPPNATATPAAQLTGVGYLPADTNLAFAVQPGPFLAYASRTNQDARELLVKAGIPAKILDSLTAAGLPLQHIDHIVGGTTIPNGPLEIRFTLALVLRNALANEKACLEKLKARRQGSGTGRYEVDLGGVPLTLAQVSPTVWVFGFDTKKDLAAVEAGGFSPGGDQLPAGLRTMVKERIPPSAALWLATNDERWAAKEGLELLTRVIGKKEWVAVVKQGRAAMVAYSFDDPPRLRVFVQAADEATAQKVRDYFKNKAGDDGKATHGGAGELAFLDTPVEPANFFTLLEQMLRDAGR